MKNLCVVMMCVLVSCKINAQASEVEQLLLNVEKLAQLKSILADMKQGFAVVTKGYITVRDISKGNFKLHDLFLDQLLQVSPTVRKYYKVKDIITMQVRLVKLCKSNLPASLSDAEMQYAGQVFKRTLAQSLENIEDLTGVLTANKYRMNDEERLRIIDGIHESIREQTQFVKQFRDKVAQLAVVRSIEQKNISKFRKTVE